jgi:hypothetical protein
MPTSESELVSPRALVSGARAARPTLTGPFDVKEREVAPLSESTVRVARAVAEAMFASEEGPPPADRLDWVTTELRGFLGHSPDASRVFRLCLFLVTALGPLLSLRIGFASRPLEERTRLLERVEKSPLSTALLGLKAVLCMLYFEHPDAARSVGAPVGEEGCKVQA